MFVAKATIDWEQGRLTLEGSEEFVTTRLEQFSTVARKSIPNNGPEEDYAHVSAMDFVAQKKPKGHHEVVAVLAFLLTQQGMEEFTEDDVRRMYLRSRVRPPKVVGQALRDAKNNFDFIENAQKRGSYKLSHHGDRTVRYDLPRTGA